MSAPAFVLAASDVLELQPEQLRLAKMAASEDPSAKAEAEDDVDLDAGDTFETCSSRSSRDLPPLVPIQVFRNVLRYRDFEEEEAPSSTRGTSRPATVEIETDELVAIQTHTALQAACYARTARWNSSDKERLLALSFLAIQRQHWRRCRASALAKSGSSRSSSSSSSGSSSSSNNGRNTSSSTRNSATTSPAPSPDRLLQRYHKLQQAMHDLEHLQRSRVTLDAALVCCAQRVHSKMGSAHFLEQVQMQGQGQGQRQAQAQVPALCSLELLLALQAPARIGPVPAQPAQASQSRNGKKSASASASANADASRVAAHKAAAAAEAVGALEDAMSASSQNRTAAAEQLGHEAKFWRWIATATATTQSDATPLTDGLELDSTVVGCRRALAFEPDSSVDGKLRESVAAAAALEPVVHSFMAGSDSGSSSSHLRSEFWKQTLSEVREKLRAKGLCVSKAGRSSKSKEGSQRDGGSTKTAKLPSAAAQLKARIPVSQVPVGAAPALANLRKSHMQSLQAALRACSSSGQCPYTWVLAVPAAGGSAARTRMGPTKRA